MTSQAETLLRRVGISPSWCGSRSLLRDAGGSFVMEKAAFLGGMWHLFGEGTVLDLSAAC